MKLHFGKGQKERWFTVALPNGRYQVKALRVDCLYVHEMIPKGGLAGKGEYRLLLQWTVSHPCGYAIKQGFTKHEAAVQFAREASALFEAHHVPLNAGCDVKATRVAIASLSNDLTAILERLGVG